MPDQDMVNEFAGLPLGLLICQPILEVAKGQNALCQVYLDNLFQLAFEKSDKDKEEELKAKTVKFTLNRTVINNGTPAVVPVTVEAPLLSLVPVPAFTMDEATVRFTMEIKKQVKDTESKTTEGKSSFGYSAWGFNAQISGSVTAQSEHTRTTDKSAKYEIYARACQQPPAEGMAKLTTVMASVVEPLEVGSK